MTQPTNTPVFKCFLVVWGGGGGDPEHILAPQVKVISFSFTVILLRQRHIDQRGNQNKVKRRVTLHLAALAGFVCLLWWSDRPKSQQRKQFDARNTRDRKKPDGYFVLDEWRRLEEDCIPHRDMM